MNRPTDTSIDANERQLEALRAMKPAARLRLADAMSTDVRLLARSGIRARHPEYLPHEVDDALAEIIVGSPPRPAVRSRPRVGAR